MKYRDVRNIIVSGLAVYLHCPVILSNQVQPETEYPFVIYSSTAPYIPDGGLGEYYQKQEGDGTAIEERREQPTCTISITVCSSDRYGTAGEEIYGEDEALDLAESAQGWFLHSGYEFISGKGITIVDVSNVQERSFLQVDEEVRRYGFDVLVRYVRSDERIIDTVVAAATIEEGENNE